MDVAVCSGTSRRRGLAGVTKVKEDQSTTAGGVAGSGANNVGKACLVVRKNVVSTAIGEVAIEAGQIILGMEDLGSLAVVDVEELEDGVSRCIHRSLEFVSYTFWRSKIWMWWLNVSLPMIM
jgi:hypothetical protein